LPAENASGTPAISTQRTESSAFAPSSPAVGAVALSRALMRGAPDELLARIDQEAKIFSERLNSPEAKAAFED
jgi:hypothetical protein